MAGYTNEQVGHSLVEYLARTARRFHIQKAILFGSRAREDHMFESDVDLVLISPDFRDMPFRARSAAALEAWTADVDLEVLCYTPEEFDRKRQDPGIVQQAAREGVELSLP